ncbi:MAG: AAA family ATPase [Candidatus Aenigmatarchaeota archaeon]
MKKIFVVIGGPGTGKSTLVKALEDKGYYCQYDDISRQIIEECVRKGRGVETDSYMFNRRLLEKRVEQFEKAPENKICFFDRGIPDGIAYMESPSEEFNEIARKYRYQPLVFALPPWKDIFRGRKHDSGRAEESFDEAIRLHEIIVKVYKNLGYNVIEIPKMTVEERAKFVVGEVAKFETRRRLKFI